MFLFRQFSLINYQNCRSPYFFGKFRLLVAASTASNETSYGNWVVNEVKVTPSALTRSQLLFTTDFSP